MLKCCVLHIDMVLARHIIFCTFVPMPMSFIIIFIFIAINHILSLKRPHLVKGSASGCYLAFAYFFSPISGWCCLWKKCVVQSLNLFQWSGSLLNNQRLCVNLDKTDATILKYQRHPSIKLIKKIFVDLPIFNFQAISVADVKEIIMELRTGKAVSREKSIKLLKDSDFSFHAWTSYIIKPI